MMKRIRRRFLNPDTGLPCNRPDCGMVCPPPIPPPKEIGLCGGARVILVNYPETICFTSLQAHHLALYQLWGADSKWIRIVDASRVQQVNLSAAELQDLQRIIRKARPGCGEERTIYFCGTNRMAFGVTRMVIAYRELDGDLDAPITLCRTLAEVQAELGHSAQSMTDLPELLGAAVGSGPQADWGGL